MRRPSGDQLGFVAYGVCVSGRTFVPSGSMRTIERPPVSNWDSASTEPSGFQAGAACPIRVKRRPQAPLPSGFSDAIPSDVEKTMRPLASDDPGAADTAAPETAAETASARS